ncbi:unnamed protein product, partial [Rotaria magnacalcarata]
GKHLYQLACGSVSLQPYFLNIQPDIRSLDVEPSKSTIKSGQTIEFSITLQPTLDLTTILDCGASSIPLEIIHIEQTIDLAPILIGNCTYSTPGQYYPLISAMNPINSVNQSIHINVDPPLSQFEVDIEDLLDIKELTVTIRALEKTSYEGVFALTIINNINERNQTIKRFVQLLESNNFTEQLDVNITTYGQQILHVRGGDFPTIREAQARFTVGTKITKKPQVYIINQVGLANKDFIWIDTQWINGVGFDIEIDYGHENKVTLLYGQFIFNSVNRTMKKIDGIHHLQWKRTAKQRLQIGY